MDVSEKDYKLEDTQKAESKAFDDLARQSVNEESISESLEETNPDGDEFRFVQNSPGGLEEEVVVVSDSVDETEPPSLDLTKTVHVVSLTQEFTRATEDSSVEDTLPNKIEQFLEDESNGVSTAVMNSVSKGIDSLSLSGQNGVSPALTNALPKRIEPTLEDEKNNDEGADETTLPASNGNTEESSNAADLNSNQNVVNTLQSAEVRAIDADKDSNLSELPESTENQPFMAVIPRPLQQTSWRGCCGLFEVLRHSDE